VFPPPQAHPEERQDAPYWLLVRSVRVGGKVRQEVVARLGKLDAKGRSRAQACANKLTGRRVHPSLFEPREDEFSDVEKVRLKAVRVERARRFGDGSSAWACGTHSSSTRRSTA
jgi:hypothetical protein